MEEQSKKYLAIGLAVVGVLFLGSMLLFSSGGDDEALPTISGGPSNDTHWVCQNRTCKNQFSLPRDQLAKHQADNPQSPTPPCPKCKQAKVAAANKCPHCGTLYVGGGRARAVCPSCKKPPVPTGRG